MSRLTLIVLLSISSLNSLIGQNKIYLTTGLGIPELLNLGVRGQFKQNELGLSFGIAPGTYSVCGDLFCHFGKVSELSSRSVWYVRSGLDYLSSLIEDYDFKEKYTYLNLRLGRDLNISKVIGLQIDAGILILLSSKTLPQPVGRHSGPYVQPPDKILPSIGLNVFFKIMIFG